MFERPHHQWIAQVLASLDAELLRRQQCWFGGGTAISLRMGEYRESIDIDFLVSDLAGYRELRRRLRGATTLAPLARPGIRAFPMTGEWRLDQYGLRGFVDAGPRPIKFEIVNEARIPLQPPAAADRICGVATLSLPDLAACKLLANSDRWRDDSVFARDAFDLAYLELPPRRLAPGLRKAMAAYGSDVAADMHRAIDALRRREGWLARCIAGLSIAEPPAAVLQRLRGLERRLRAAEAQVGKAVSGGAG